MKISLDSFFNVDRRIIFIFVFLSILIPMLFPFSMPIRATSNVQALYDNIERTCQAKERNTILLSFDFDPQTKAELEPPARAMLRQIFAHKGRVLIMTHVQAGVGLHEQIIRECAQEYGAVEGVDYAYLGWKAGGSLLVISMGQDFGSAYQTDAHGHKTSDMPVTKGVMSLRDIGYLVEVTGLTSVTDWWILYAQGRYNLPTGVVVTGVMAPDQYNYINSGQITGMSGGLVGAAQYEQLIKDNGVYVVRRFSGADLVSRRMPGFCARLTAGKDAVSRRVWNRLTQPQKDEVAETVKVGDDQLSPATMAAIAAALNVELADRNPRTQPDTQPDAGRIEEADLAAVKAELPKSVSELLARPDVAAVESQVLRRLYLEKEYGAALVKAQSNGQAVTWMTPQSIAHLVLIAAIIVGNICYLIERARRRKAEKA